MKLDAYPFEAVLTFIREWWILGAVIVALVLVVVLL